MINARRCSGGEAGAEVLGEGAQDLPLLGVGVLRLVHEDVVDPPVELVQDPAGADAAEQVERLVDQVVEVEGAEAGLLRLDAAVDLGGDLEQRLRAGQALRARSSR